MKRVIWINSSYKDFMKFPPEVRHMAGYVLHHAQLGKKHEHIKVLSGMGSACIAEIKESGPNGTYRIIYSIEMKGFLFVLHAFQKKSKTGIATPKQELELLKNRITEAKALYAKLQDGGGK